MPGNNYYILKKGDGSDWNEKEVLAENGKVLSFDSSLNPVMVDVPANPMTTAGDIIYGGTSGVATRLAKGTAAQVLTMNTGATAPEWAAVPDNSFTEYDIYFDDFIYDAIITEYTDTSGSVSINHGIGGSYAQGVLYLDTTSTPGASAKVYQKYSSTSASNANLLPILRAAARLNPDYSLVQQLTEIGFARNGGPISSSNTGWCFRYQPAVSEVNFYSISHNGSSQTSNDTGVTGFGNYTKFKIVYESTSSLKFYINGTLVATHTTNIPDGASGNNQLAYAYTKNEGTQAKLGVDYLRLTMPDTAPSSTNRAIAD